MPYRCNMTAVCLRIFCVCHGFYTSPDASDDIVGRRLGAEQIRERDRIKKFVREVVVFFPHPERFALAGARTRLRRVRKTRNPGTTDGSKAAVSPKKTLKKLKKSSYYNNEAISARFSKIASGFTSDFSTSAIEASPERTRIPFEPFFTPVATSV